MKRRVMVDLNVILDVLENRAEWVAASAGEIIFFTGVFLPAESSSFTVEGKMFSVTKGTNLCPGKSTPWEISHSSGVMRNFFPAKKLCREQHDHFSS